MKIRMMVLTFLFVGQSFAYTPLWMMVANRDSEAIRSYVDSMLQEFIGSDGTMDDFIAFNNALDGIEELVSDPDLVMQEIERRGGQLDDGLERQEQNHSEIREFVVLNLSGRNGPYSAAVVEDAAQHASLSGVRHLLLYGFSSQTFFDQLNHGDESGETPLMHFFTANRMAGVRLMLALGADFSSSIDERPSLFRMAMLSEDSLMRRLFLLSLLDRLLHGNRMRQAGCLFAEQEALNITLTLSLYDRPAQPQLIPSFPAQGAVTPHTIFLPEQLPLNPYATVFVPRGSNWRL